MITNRTSICFLIQVLLGYGSLIKIAVLVKGLTIGINARRTVEIALGYARRITGIQLLI